MLRTQQRWLAGVLGLGMFGAALGCCSWVRMAVRKKDLGLTAALTVGRFGPPVPRNHFERVIREAWRWRMQAWRDMNEERYALEAWDPTAADSLDSAVLDKQLLADDRSGSLKHARRLGALAAALAGTPRERYRAALLLAMVARDAGNRRTELQQTRVLVRLAPHSSITFCLLRHVVEHRRASRRRLFSSTAILY